jgi:hypothetical protein
MKNRMSAAKKKKKEKSADDDGGVRNQVQREGGRLISARSQTSCSTRSVAP